MKFQLSALALTLPLTVGLIAIEDNAQAAKRGQTQSYLTLAEAQDLTFLREEEKLARDVYLALYAQWGVSIFQNIASSEQTHMDQVLGLLQTYNLPDPVGGQPAGVFTNVDLQKLYYDLVAQGSASVEAAMTVGATIEDLDIADIDHMIANTNRSDLLTVYDNLTKGSRNHLRSFVGQLDSMGVEYSPQFISVEEYEAIINSASETGNTSSGSGNPRKGGRGGR